MIALWICQVILILGTVCKRGGCSNIKLHIVSNALTNHNMLTELEKILDDKKETLPIVRFEPAVNRAIDFALAEGLVEIQNSNSKIKLTSKGKNLYDEIINDKNIMIIEKQELDVIRDKLKDSIIDRIVEKWGITNVTD